MDAAKRIADADKRAGEARSLDLARDAAVMALLYGSGLRISEALGLKRRDVPKPGEGDVLVVTGKGNKTRMVPVLQNVLALIADYVAMCPHPLAPSPSRFSSARAADRFRPRIIQLTMERLRGALGLPDSATPMRCGIPSPPICSAVAAICAPSRELLGHASLSTTQIYTASTASGFLRFTRQLIRAPEAPSNSRRRTPASAIPSSQSSLARDNRARREEIMGAHESMEHAEHAEHASSSNKRIALLIAVIALFLALSETLGKSAQTEALSQNIEASNLWAFFQAKSVHRTTVRTAGREHQTQLEPGESDASFKTIACKSGSIDWNKTAARCRSEPETREGRSSSPRAPRRPKKSATRRSNTTTSRPPRPRSRSASCWPRPPSSPAWRCVHGARSRSL